MAGYFNQVFDQTVWHAAKTVKKVIVYRRLIVEEELRICGCGVHFQGADLILETEGASTAGMPIKSN